jgi:ornithine carbamoyltransferase
MNNFISISEINKEELLDLISLAESLQQEKEKNGFLNPYLKGKSLALIFQKPSLRTHIAFEIAMKELGGNTVFLGPNDIFRADDGCEREPTKDIIRNLENFVNIILIRLSEFGATEIARNISKVPIINGLCENYHPTQALADIYAIKQHFKVIDKLKVSWVGDGNNVATSLAQACSLLGIEFHIATPKGSELLKQNIIGFDNIFEYNNAEEAVKNANVVTTESWYKMGHENRRLHCQKKFSEFRVTKKIMSFANKNAVFMHCLPAHRGEEVDDEVIESNQSIVFKESVSRLYIARALLLRLLKISPGNFK